MQVCLRCIIHKGYIAPPLNNCLLPTSSGLDRLTASQERSLLKSAITTLYGPDGPLAIGLCLFLTPWLSPSDTCKSMHSWAGKVLISLHVVSKSLKQWQHLWTGHIFIHHHYARTQELTIPDSVYCIKKKERKKDERGDSKGGHQFSTFPKYFGLSWHEPENYLSGIHEVAQIICHLMPDNDIIVNLEVIYSAPGRTDKE